MSSQTKDWERVAQALESLQAEVARLGQRVSALEGGRGEEAAAPAVKPPTKAPAAVAPPPTETGSRLEGEELALVIAAAVAAFLGKRAHIRQIRLLGSGAWSQQGRVTIQASHDISSHSGRSRP